MAWKKLDSNERYRTPWMSVTEDTVVTSAGKQFVWTVVHQRPCALIIPWDGEQFTLVGLYRYPTGCFSWEFPCGSVADASIEEAAKRELKEETGMTADDYEWFGKLNFSGGTTNQTLDVYVATGLTDGQTELEAEEEGMETKKATYAELVQMINDGTMKESSAIAAFMLLHTKGWIEKHGLK